MAGGSYQTVSTVSLGEMNPSVATWNSSTVLNTTASLLSADFSANTLIVTLQQTTTITGGVVTFQYSTDGVNWQNVTGVIPGTTTLIGPTYNLVANTYALFEFNVTGFSYFQVVLSTVISGTGAVTIGYSGDSFVGDTITLAAPVTISGTVSSNLTQLNGTTLGSGTNWSTAPATSVNVQGVNAELFVGQNAVSAAAPVPVSATAAANASGNPIFVETVSGSTTVVTGTVAVTQSTSPWVVSLTSTTITGTVAVTQSTSPWVVAGNLTHNNAAPAATNIGALTGVASSAAPTYNAGDQVLLSTDLAGNTRVVLNAETTKVIGTVNQGTSPWVVSLTSTTITGTVAVTQSTTPWTIQGDSASGAAKAGNPVQIGGVFNTTQPTVTTGQTVEAQATARGAFIVATGVDAFNVNATQTTSPWVVSLTSTTITGTVAVTQSTSPWVSNVTQWASTALGTPQTFGSAPTGVVIGTSSDIYVAGTRARSNQTTTAAGVVDVNIVGSLGVTNSVTNGTFIAITDNTTKAGVIAATTALKTDQSSQAGTAITTVPVAFGTGTPSGNAPGVNSALFVGTTPVRSNQTTTATGAVDVNNVGIDGTTIVTAAAGVQKVGIVGNAGATMDAAVGAGTAPSNGLVTLGIYSSTGVTPSAGQSVALQLDQEGNHLQFPGVQQSVGAAWSSATTLNTLQYPTGTATQGQLVGIPAIMVQLDQTTTLTGGKVTFQGTYDNINWVSIPVAQIIHPQTFAQLTNPYTFVASTQQPFMILLQGFISVRLNLTTVITGTGTVTPYWATLPDNPITTTVVTGTSSTGSIQVSVVPSANTYFRFGNVTTASSATNVKVESTTYTEQSTAVQRSIVSSSANDTSAGTGARTVQITYYDASGNGPFTETDTLNGTTAVNTTATNICFIEMIQILTVGSTGSNVGTITLFSTTGGGGSAVGTIAATQNRTFWGHHYVPSGKTFHLTGVNVGSNSTTGGNGGNFTLFAQSLPVANQVNNQISDNLLLYGQSSNVTRSYNSPIAVPGPARVTMFVLPLANASVTFYGSFDFFEQ